MCGRLVVPLIFKISVTGDPGQAGSIPVRLRRAATLRIRGTITSMDADPRRQVPSTDRLLSDERLAAPIAELGRAAMRSLVHAAQAKVREGALAADAVVDEVLRTLPRRSTTLQPVINATGVVLHTNLGRAPLSDAARTALLAAAGYADVEFDLDSGRRARRGRGAFDALRRALPEAGDVMLVNNGAAALLLAITTLAQGREVVWSRGEMVEIGDGFRLPELVASTGARIREVGTTNRTTLADYAAALGPDTGCVLKVHPSNFTVTGFTHSVPVAELAGLGVPLVVDAGSGLLRPDPLLRGEPDMAGALRDGAGLVTSSGDKLLGGPQAGLLAGTAELVARLRRHPLARALRVDKLTLAALEATLAGPEPPATLMRTLDGATLRQRTEMLCRMIGGDARVEPAAGAVGGGSAPGHPLPGWAVSLPERFTAALRTGNPPVVARTEGGRCLIDLRCVEVADDEAVAQAVLRCT